MEKEKKFNATAYKLQWAKEHKKQFKVDLNIEEYNLLNDLLTKKRITKAQFLRTAIEELKKK